MRAASRAFRTARRAAGMTIYEVIVAASIVAVITAGALSFLVTEWRQEELNRDRSFAYDRAQSMLEELRAFAEVSEDEGASTLDGFDDGAGFSYSLTTQRQAAPNQAQFVDPAAPVSGNSMSRGRWRYARRITVRHLPGVEQRDVRIVTVRIFLNAAWDTPPGPEIANCSSVVRTVADATPPTQVYDVYLVALENVPGWWVYMDTIRPFVESTLRDLTARNPGLKIRAHWITKLGYGRDPEYTPYFNEETPSTDPIPYAYFYPGSMPDGSASLRYYVPGMVKARVNVDGLIRNGWDAASNPLPYALADQHDHCLRLPDEEALFQARVAAGLENAGEPTWRLLLEHLRTNPDEFRNAIIVNLHGEMLPLPPVRNYSDAARAPERLPGVRVVTHPEKIRFALGASPEDVRLRVHTYRTDPSAAPELLSVPVIVEIPGMDLTANVNGSGSGATTLQVRRIRGGLDLAPRDGSRDVYAADDAPIVLGRAARTLGYPGEPYARVWWSATAYGGAGATVVELHNSALIAPRVGNQGLDPSKRLYGMEYVPCSTEAANDFSVDLTTDGVVEKNTARWTLRIPAAMLGGADRRVDAVTRIGLDVANDSSPDSGAFATGIMYPPSARMEPRNASTTYCWSAASPEAVPFTERYQFLGDPRHCPYADLKSGGTSFPNGYDWYFDDFQNGVTNAVSAWPGFDAARLKNDGNASNDGWMGRVEADVPRLFQLLREGLQSSNCVFTTLAGFSYYYVGLGNEIGYDSANGYPSSIPVSGQPFGSNGTGYEQSITLGAATWGSGVKYVRSGAGGNYWWEKPWLGELCPDTAYAASWKVPVDEDQSTVPGTRKGNLPAGSSSTTFRRVPRDQIAVNLPAGTTLRPAQRSTAAEGCTSFFDVGATSTTVFHHQYQDGTYGAIGASGTEVANDFHFPIPASAKISRPFRLATSGDGGVGDEFAYPADYPRSTATLRGTYYGHSTGATGAALVELSQAAIPTPAYFVLSGLDKTTESGSTFLARFAMLTLIHGFLSAGDPALPNPVSLRPRVVVAYPTATTELIDPATITLRWHTEWRRWDGIPYTESFPVGWSPPESDVEYVLMYSADNGMTWRHVRDDSPATPGVLPPAILREVDAVPGGDESYDWPVPRSRFPTGTYKLRIEAYRAGARLHYSFHEERMYIDR